MHSVLKLENVNAFYDKSHILFDLNLEVEAGKSVCILGRNGVGKSTTMKTIIGIMNPKNHCKTDGNIMINGWNAVGSLPNKIAQAGVAYVPQGRHIFPNLTTKENLLIAKRDGMDGKNIWNIERIYELFPRLKERETSMGGKLSGGEQQMLAVARGLMQNPQIMLLDEITEGLAPIIVQQLSEIVQNLIKQGATILIAEQNVKFALSVSEKCYIMEKGSIVHESLNSQLSKETIAKYLGA